MAAAEADKRFSRIGNLRLLAGLAGAALAFFVFGSAQLSPWWLALPVSAFIGLAVIHSGVAQALDHARRALRFYQQGQARLENRWMGAGEQGNRFREPNHLYAEDLDLFGKGSLYELLCTVRTRAGEDTLARWLMSPATLTEAEGRQRAVRELTGRLELRENLALLGEDVRAGLHADALAGWGESPPVAFPAGLPVLAAVLSACTTLSLVGYLSGFSGRIPFLLLLLAQLATAYAFRPKVRGVVEGAELPSHDLGLLAQLLERVEAEPAASPYLQSLKDGLKTDGLLASQQIARLERLATRVDWQHNEFFKPVAALLMWSTQLAVAIEKWRQHSGGAIRRWIAAAGARDARSHADAGENQNHHGDPMRRDVHIVRA